MTYFQENGSIYVSMDAIFGCVRKISAGTSVQPPNYGEMFFINQEKVDSFLEAYRGKYTVKSQVHTLYKLRMCSKFTAYTTSVKKWGSNFQIPYVRLIFNIEAQLKMQPQKLHKKLALIACYMVFNFYSKIIARHPKSC